MELVAFVISIVVTVCFVLTVVLGAVYLVFKFHYEAAGRLELGHGVRLVFGPRMEGAALYQGRRLVDSAILTFEYRSFHFYLLSASGAYRVGRFSRKVEAAGDAKLSRRENELFERMRGELSSDAAEKEQYYRALREQFAPAAGKGPGGPGVDDFEEKDFIPEGKE